MVDGRVGEGEERREANEDDPMKSYHVIGAHSSEEGCNMKGLDLTHPEAEWKGGWAPSIGRGYQAGFIQAQ